MLEFDTFTLLLIMGSLIILSAVGLHYKNCSNLIRKKRLEFISISSLLKKKINDLKRETVDLQMQIDKIDKQINSMQRV